VFDGGADIFFQCKHPTELLRKSPLLQNTHNKKLENDIMKTLVQCIRKDSMQQQAQSPVLEMQKHSQNS
jgi:hypothetical protein